MFTWQVNVYKSELRPVDLPRDGFELMDTEGSFSKSVLSIVKKAEAKGLWKAPEDVPIVLSDHYFWAYWLYKTAHPIKQPMPGYNLEEYFEPFLTHIFDLNPDGFQAQHAVDISFAGDLMATQKLNNSADTLYKDVANLIFDADLAYANLESTLTTQPIAPLEYSTDKPTIINITPQAYDVISRWKGKCYDLVHLANNHVLDCGAEGIETTLAYLRRDSIRQIGINETVADQIQPTITDVHGMSIGWVAHTYDVDSMPFPAGKPHIVNMTPFHMVADPDLSLIENQIKSCRDAGCDFVILSLHWGLEFELYPHPDQLKWAHRFAECGADMIVGHHPHVIQHMEIYHPQRNPQRPVPIIYSLGNLTPIKSHPATVASIVARLSLAQGTCGGQSTTYPTRLTLTPVVTLQLGTGDNAALGIYALAPILSQARQKHRDQFYTYLAEVADYVDSVLGNSWRD